MAGPVISRALWMPLIVGLLIWLFVKQRKERKKKLDAMDDDEGEEG